MSSRYPRFYQLPPAERLATLRSHLDDESAKAYQDGLTLEAADLMVENVISTFALPCAVAINFVINGEDRIVPMVVEEPSVVAAVSNMAKLTRACGGFEASSDPSHMIGQIQLSDVSDVDACIATLNQAMPTLRQAADRVHPRLVARGGGLVSVATRAVTYDEPDKPIEHMVVVEFTLDVVDAMGANLVNTMAEALAPVVADITGESVALRILSNLADRRLARARVRLDPEVMTTDTLSGTEVADRIAAAWRFAWADPHRAATHNKGVMNGIDAVALATGNDWRAIEAGAHAYCCRDGQYRPMTRWERGDDGSLVGSIEIPLQFGTVGGPIRAHPTVKSNLTLLNARGARDLAAVAAAVGLAQNLGALKALATVGIQQGHMRMHARLDRLKP